MHDKKTLYVFPTSRAIREFIFGFKAKDTLLPSAITIDELLKKSINLNSKKYESKEQRVIFLNEAIKNVDLNKLGFSKNFSQFLKQSDYIYRFFLELSSENRTIDDIKRVDTYMFYNEHLEILDEILKNYLTILERNSCVNKINLNKNYTINSKFLSRFEKIIIKFEGYFTKQEFEIISKISDFIDLEIEFYKNIYNNKSIEIFNNFNFEFKDDYRYLINLSKKEVISENRVDKNNNINIKGFSNRLSQVAFIKSTIVNLVNCGVDASNIAVVLPNEDFAKTLKLNDKEEYFNFAMGNDILNKNLYQKAYVVSNYINEDDIKNIKSLEFFQIDKKIIDDNIKKVWNDRLNIDNFKFITNFIKESETDKELIEKYDEMIYFLESLFFTSDTFLRIKDAYKIFLQNLANIKLDDINSGKITVMGLLETRAINFDAVIICDFNEEFIPKISIKDKFLSSKIKKLASLPTTKDRENLQRYYYKRLVENSKEVFISYVNSKDSSISRFAYELFAYKQDKLFDTEYKDILYTNKKLEHSSENIVQNIDLKQFTWSASALKSYLECKRKWYLNYILKIKEHTISNLPKSFELGNIVHKILEEYYKNSNTNIDDLFIKYRANNPFLTLDLEIYKQKVKSFIEFDKKRLENREIVELEKSFVVDFNDFKITGVIDRVDRYKDSYEVIDYKTSRSLKVDTEKNYEKSFDFQLEFYFLAIKTLYEPQQIRAFYYDIYENLLKEEIALEPKLELLKTIFDDFKNQSKSQIDFSKTEDSSRCEFCPYKTICNKD
ncbi:hypothetical protein CRU94_02365 [Arcobacter sp. AHV-9/2010]|uniref:PD-(D/E)XK nuclease family protein n=1 Tax=Arcobacter sp. AHV-9/2010 TaxID=2021861 RepID=UPI00100BEB3D|nr:PD-(D/E)XK nuclease family protein [Arcobacter sp. CECT 9299]RXJ96980.1 hypothetical protein CRU94_02365 [Arcobacter sp. CECT 9299]